MANQTQTTKTSLWLLIQNNVFRWFWSRWGLSARRTTWTGTPGRWTRRPLGSSPSYSSVRWFFFFIFSSRLISISIYSPSSSSSVSQASFLKECFRFQYLNRQFLPWLSKYINSALQHFPSYLVVAANQYGCHTPPSASQVQLQKVGMWPNYTAGGVFADACIEIFPGGHLDRSIFNLQSSNIPMNPSQRNWSCFISPDNPLPSQQYLSFLLSCHFKYSNANWPLNQKEEEVQVQTKVQVQVQTNVLSFQVSAKFMIEDDEEQMKEELKEAFRIYDKEVKCQKWRKKT